MVTDSSEHNTYIFDPESPTEMARLINQGNLVTKAMGSPLAGIDDPSSLHTILDVGCGPGGWALDVAFAYPSLEVAGIDISKIMVDYANARARSQGLTNASFGIMDITQPLDFPDASFDLVNARFLFGVLRAKDWPPFLAECFRILKPGGIIRLTELVDAVSTSPATETQMQLLFRFLQMQGYGFAPTGRGVAVATVLPRLLRQAGYTLRRNLAYVLSSSYDTEEWAEGYHNQEVLSLSMLPLFAKVGLISEEEVQQIYEQTLIEWHSEDFCSMGYFHTVLAVKN